MKDVKGGHRDPTRMLWILVSGKTVGSQNLAMCENETYPDGMVPEHKYDMEDEMMFFLAGRQAFLHRRLSVLKRETGTRKRSEDRMKHQLT